VGCSCGDDEGRCFFVCLWVGGDDDMGGLLSRVLGSLWLLWVDTMVHLWGSGCFTWFSMIVWRWA
jgi:hypothetical protein